MADNNNQTSSKKKRQLNSMKSLSMLDNIIGRNDNEDIINNNINDEQNDLTSALDDINISSSEHVEDSIDDVTDNDMFNDMSKVLDNILLSSKSQAKQNKTTNVPQEVVRNTNTETFQYLNLDDTLFTTTNMPIKVLNNIPSFEHIPAYIVRFMNSNYILKWYNKSSCNNLKDLKLRMEKISKNGTLPKYVLKPRIFTKTTDSDCFGCLYTDITQDYFTLGDYIKSYILEYDGEHMPKRKKIKFKSMSAMVTASINIAKIFNELNNNGVHFHSFYEENLMININNGDVLLDTSNCLTNKDVNFKVDTQCTYLAPELLNGSSSPNTYTDTYLLAVILFRIFFHDHPLEGKRVIDDVSLDFKQNIKYYTENALFILNPNDSSNRPVRGVHYTVLSMWEKYPQYLREIFVELFSNKIFIPKERYPIEQWIPTLLHLKSDILPCICGRVDFSFLYEFTKEAFYQCQRCGSKYHSVYFRKRNFKIPVYTGNNIYTIFLKDKVSSFDDVMGIVIENKIHTNLNGLKNVGNVEWKCTLSNGDLKDIKPSDVLPIFEGTTIDIGGSMAQFDFTNAK